MRVLFQARKDLLTSRGGDTVQLIATRRHLIQRGVEVDLESSATSDCSLYDVVHLFNLTRPYDTFLQLENAKRQGKPVCLSTIYWNMDDLHLTTRVPIWMLFARANMRILRYLYGFANGKARHRYLEKRMMASPEAVKACQSRVVENADMLLPNSRAELDLLHCDLPSSRQIPFSIVHNGIDSHVFSRSSEPSLDFGQVRNRGQYILCAGRLEDRKNQVRLLRAMSTSDIPVVLVGGTQSSRSYAAEVHRNAKPLDAILGEVSQKELAGLYANARVHVLPSLYDTPGLSSLEAGAMGCNLVMSEIGCQHEYFGESVEYCNPHSEEDIMLAVKRAWERPWPNTKLASFIRSNYTWEVAARQTHEAYKLLLRRDT